MTAQSLLQNGHCNEKILCVFSKEKSVAMATSFERSQPHFTAIIYAHNSENFLKISRVVREISGLESVVKPEAVSAVRVIQQH